MPRIDVHAYDTLAVDMPIGLPDTHPREADRAARAFVGPRRSSVFPTPPRACLSAADYTEALAAARRSIGRGISKQAFHLIPKIREVDEQLTPADEDRVCESHPECSFVVMNGGAHLPSKHTPAGIALRRSLVVGHFGVELPPMRGAQIDDVLDAYALLFTAERFARGEALVLGDGARDGRGLRMRIVV